MTPESENGSSLTKNHLKTEKERRDRWYCKDIWPRFILVADAKSWSEVLAPVEDVSLRAKSIPIDWLTNADASSNNNLRCVLIEHGFAVISGVLSEAECRNALKLAWDYLEAASVAHHYSAVSTNTESASSSCLLGKPPLRRCDGSTHAAENMPQSVEGGMLPYYGSGHSTLAWSVRSHPSVYRIFSFLYPASNQLVSSMDGVILWLDAPKEENGGWFHIDQSPIYKPRSCGIQGLVNLLPVTQATGGNVLVAHSHRHFPHHYTATTTDLFYKERLKEVKSDDWLEIDPNDNVILQPQHVLSLLLRPGHVLLWDSRVVHCSYPPKPNQTPPEFGREAHGLIRAAVLVSMMPEETVEHSVLLQRKEAVGARRTLTHWVDKVAPLGEERPEQVALEKSRVAAMHEWQSLQGTKAHLGYEELSEEQRRLVVGSNLL